MHPRNKISAWDSVRDRSYSRINLLDIVGNRFSETTAINLQIFSKLDLFGEVLDTNSLILGVSTSPNARIQKKLDQQFPKLFCLARIQSGNSK